MELMNSRTEEKILMALERIERKLDELKINGRPLGAPPEMRFKPGVRYAYAKEVGAVIPS